MMLCILGDTHFGARGDSVDFLNFFEKFYENTFFPYLIENNIDTVFQLGDLFDRRKYINFNSLYLCRKYFFDKLRDNNIKMYTLLGNHDISYKNTLKVNSSELLLKEYKNVYKNVFYKKSFISFLLGLNIEDEVLNYHPTEKGHQLWASNLAKYISSKYEL